jgi:hypothetical protein
VGVDDSNFHHIGCAMGDFNCDGLLDLVVGNSYNDWSRKPVFVAEFYPGPEENQLFLQDTRRDDGHSAATTTATTAASTTVPAATSPT